MNEPSVPDISGLSKVEQTVELVKRLCLALTNVEMFSADHPMGKKGVDTAYELLAQMLERRGEPVVISVAGKTIVLDGMSLEERNPLVNKLAAKLDDVHVSSLVFDPGVTAEEFHAFYSILGKGPKVVNAEGGLEKMMEEASIQRIRMEEISYVMVGEDQKVVSKDAQVIEARAAAGVGADADIVQYMVGKFLEKAEEQRWLMNEIKNNPQEMATRIGEAIELATSRAEMGLQDEDGTIQTLLKNIQLVGQGLMTTDGEVKEGEGDLEKALLTLENEIRLRSSKLMSSKVATGFINEILGVVTAYSDRVRAKLVSDEFLKGETSMKRTEKLLKDMAPKLEPADKFLLRVRNRLADKGMSQEELDGLLKKIEKATEEPKAKKPRKKKRKTFSKAVADGVAKRVKELDLGEGGVQKLTEEIGPFIEQRAKERAGEFKEEADMLRGQVEREERLLDEVPVGVVLWDEEGKPALVNRAAKETLKDAAVGELTEGLQKRLAEWSFPLAEVPDVAAETDLTNADIELLMNVARAVKDADGSVYGVIFMPGKG